MPRQSVKIQSPIEVTAISAIVVMFIFAEQSFGAFTYAANTIFAAFPILHDYAMALIGGCWMGLCAYALRRRWQIRRERILRMEVEADIEILKTSDELTGLPNQHAFELALDERLNSEERKPITVLGIDICNLDTISSIHGSEISDRIEVLFSEFLMTLFGEDDFVARGDQAKFYSYAGGGTTDENHFRMDEIIEKITEFSSVGIETNGINLQVYVTFGLLDVDEWSYRHAKWDAESILRRIDFARHKARRSGHLAVETFDIRMEAVLHQRAMVEASLSPAIRAGQIKPHFQPLIDLQTREVIGFEALARWSHPTQGEVSPGIFVPIAEDIGVLRLLTLSMLRQSCEAARNWPEHLSISINISPTDLRDVHVMESFMAILQETGTDPKRIEVEITENAFIEEAGSIGGAIRSMKNEGISVSIDDFGTGYSSLHHLRILPFDKLKIDQSFVRDMVTNAESRAIVQSVIAMAASLNLKTTGEGIEDELTAGALRDLGCTIGQGYLYSKAIPQAEVPAFLEDFSSKRQFRTRSLQVA